METMQSLSWSFVPLSLDESDDEDEGLMRETMKKETQLLVDSKTKKKPQDDEEEEDKGKQKRRWTLTNYLWLWDIMLH